MRKIFALLLACMLFAAPVRAEQALDYNDFARIPVLEEGRVKPLDSYARTQLRRFSGAESFAGQGADAWLAGVFFDPSHSIEKPVFRLDDKNLKARLELPETQTYFTYGALQAGLKATAVQAGELAAREAGTLDPEQQALLKLHEDAALFMNLHRAFSFSLPLDVELPKAYADKKILNYKELADIGQKLTAQVKALVRRKGEDPQAYNADERKQAKLAYELGALAAGGALGTEPRLFPAEVAGEEWRAPWQVVLNGEASPQDAGYLARWQEMSAAYRQGDVAAWNKAAQEARVQGTHMSGAAESKLALEIFYNRLKPFTWALALYALAAVLTGAAGFAQRFIPQSVLVRGAYAAFIAASVVQAVGVGMRMEILSRPPVGTLYESLLFVSLICALAALFTALKTGSRMALAAGALTGAGLLAIAPYLAQGGDSMEMLVAVLNTNFWLATHVVCITAGYGICVLGAGLAHFYMGLRAWGRNPDSWLVLEKPIYKISIVALLFTALGTALGGVWADQSWGRFWGWDPKENGALLIVLWLIWVLHGRHSTKMGPAAFAASMAWLNVIVALAWFGVNLLSVGLHSYGFTSGLAWALGLFCAGETAIVGGLWAAITVRERKANVA